ncbi:MAG: type II and III secretion system protein family protein [Hyphomonadaceae bacterium]|nr:MAG: pilus assembly protein CpaC [Caulobacteraceae bacterium]MBT9447009.1 type II and III secretion system protein family protein [Hyphomonadaceae bacterium]TPW08818.1 MAG: pilus assembly protein CpaC [Alphaproteobacteria bacterium]
MRRSPLAVSLAALLALGPAFTASADTQAVQHIRVTRGGEGANASTLTLSLNKAAIIDLPADARDVLLSNPEIADAVVRTARRIYILGRKVGQTNAFFFDAAGRQVANVEISVEPDVAPLNDLFRRYVPDTNATAEAINGSFVLSGSVKSAAEAERVLQIANRFAQSSSAAAGGAGAQGGASANQQIVNLIAVEGQEQVLVKVRIVEMSRTLVRQLGVNLNAENLLNQLLPEDTFVKVATQNGYSIAGRALGGLAANGGIAESILRPSTYSFPGPNGGTLNPDSALVGGYNVTPIQDTAGNIIGSQVTNGPGTLSTENQVDASIEAFERVGLLRVLAEPNLTAISGESAKFLAGGEFPVPVQADDGKISVEFKPFGVGLAFTPVVLSPGRISLKLSTEVSELTSEGAFGTGDTSFVDVNGQRQVIRGITIPALQVRRAETTVEMPSGGALVMAGLIQERTRQALEGIPGAKDLPVFGPLFRSRDFVNNETELVIIVTPYLVQPTRPDRLRTPADGFRVASERETILSGRLNAIYRAPEGGETRSLAGPHGHVIEGRPAQ